MELYSIITEDTMYKRTLAKAIKEINNSFPVLLMTGARQVGKTTLLELCAKKIVTI